MSDRRLRLTQQAQQHLRDIERSSRRDWGDDRTDIYLSDLRQTLQRLRKSPEQGRKRPDIRPGYRSCLCGRHLIYYRFDDEFLIVVAILHERMDVRRFF